MSPVFALVSINPSTFTASMYPGESRYILFNISSDKNQEAWMLAYCDNGINGTIDFSGTTAHIVLAVGQDEEHVFAMTALSDVTPTAHTCQINASYFMPDAPLLPSSGSGEGVSVIYQGGSVQYKENMTRVIALQSALANLTKKYNQLLGATGENTTYIIHLQNTINQFEEELTAYNKTVDALLNQSSAKDEQINELENFKKTIIDSLFIGAFLLVVLIFSIIYIASRNTSSNRNSSKNDAGDGDYRH